MKPFDATKEFRLRAIRLSLSTDADSGEGMMATSPTVKNNDKTPAEWLAALDAEYAKLRSQLAHHFDVADTRTASDKPAESPAPPAKSGWVDFRTLAAGDHFYDNPGGKLYWKEDAGSGQEAKNCGLGRVFTPETQVLPEPAVPSRLRLFSDLHLGDLFRMTGLVHRHDGYKSGPNSYRPAADRHPGNDLFCGDLVRVLFLRHALFCELGVGAEFGFVDTPNGAYIKVAPDAYVIRGTKARFTEYNVNRQVIQLTPHPLPAVPAARVRELNRYMGYRFEYDIAASPGLSSYSHGVWAKSGGAAVLVAKVDNEEFARLFVEALTVEAGRTRS